MTDKKEPRYFVDQRGGCIAVRDREHKDHDPDYNGLHPDTGGVVKYWSGFQREENKSKGYPHWDVKSSDVEDAITLCQELNIADSEPKAGDTIPNTNKVVSDIVRELVESVNRYYITENIVMEDMFKREAESIVRKYYIPDPEELTDNLP